jgi:kynureninase
VGYRDPVDGGPLTRAHATELDRADPLGGYRERFELGDGDRIYVDGNSLGRLSRDARAALEAIVDDWGTRLVTGWHDWVDLAGRTGDTLGTAALGAAPGQALACDSTTVNLYKLAAAALDARPGRSVIVTDDDNFPTDQYILQGLAHARGLELRTVKTDIDTGVRVADVIAALDDDVALVSLSHVANRSGAIAGI